MVERTGHKSRKLPLAAQIIGTLGGFAGALGLGATCGGGETNKTPTPNFGSLPTVGRDITPSVDNPTSPNNIENYSLPFAVDEEWYLNAGPHPDVGDQGVKNAIDVAPREVINCDQSPHGIIDNRFVRAVAAGKVTTSGNPNDATDLNHSIVRIKDNSGVTENYVHLANIKVNKDDTVSQGQILGSPSCEYPAKTGSTTGAHAHVSFTSADGVPIDITTITLAGWSIQSLPPSGLGVHNGTMIKDGQVRTANIFRCGPKALPLNSGNCNGTRNDISLDVAAQGQAVSTMAEVATLTPVPTQNAEIPTVAEASTPKPVETPIVVPIPTSPPVRIPTDVPKNPDQSGQDAKFKIAEDTVREFYRRILAGDEAGALAMEEPGYNGGASPFFTLSALEIHNCRLDLPAGNFTILDEKPLLVVPPIYGVEVYYSYASYYGSGKRNPSAVVDANNKPDLKVITRDEGNKFMIVGVDTPPTCYDITKQ